MCLFVQSTGEATNEILLLRGRRLYPDDPGAGGLRPTYVQGGVVLSSSVLTSLGLFVLAPDRAEPPLWECVPDLQAAFQFQILYAVTYRNIEINLTWRAGMIVVSKVAPAPLVSLSFVSEGSSRVLPEQAVFRLLR